MKNIYISTIDFNTHIDTIRTNYLKRININKSSNNINQLSSNINKSSNNINKSTNINYINSILTNNSQDK
jgi:hypothetical protein